MQDKNKLDDMAEKYKNEMMRLYSRNRTAANKTAPPQETAAEAVRIPKTQPAAMPQTEQKTVSEAKSARDFSNPPMPKIPRDYGSGAGANPVPETSQTMTPASKMNTASKFPSAEEIMRAENSSVPAMARMTPMPPEISEHNQGNYDFPAVPDMETENGISEITPNEQYPTESTDFESVDPTENFPTENPSEMSGQGYLQIEVTTANGAVPVNDAAVIVTERINGMDSLIGMAVTNADGATPVIPLAAPPRSLSGAPEPTERPFSEYNISVYKKGFYSVPQLTVPIFDTIKSIQPVSLIPLAEFELSGTETPTSKRR